MRRVGYYFFKALYWTCVFLAFFPALGAQLADAAVDRMRQ